MRVVAGIHKGRQLKAVPGKSTRPTTDKVKEAVFQVMGPFFDGGICLDLFAGSGSLGIEAISRGMNRCIFIDKHPKAIQTIKENVRSLKIDESIEVFRADAYRALKAAAKRELTFKLIFLDPPYGKVDYEELLNEIVNHQLIETNGIIYCEHDPAETISFSLESFRLVKQVNYSGTIGVTILEHIN
ncbi:16S rRNA (guanine(966)-N(2))-methyltransferase RsmD [Ornithinibacillus sp. L9]|uniref:16S rRNA (Guanine(966)-N(2))-methyltransferase RsmD n=1 Tax=Ornithinibacillus caprae TaxID=2678566 RepID=A0A6N8FIX1_9BACI|nr:16S rRNA (guanine(966)-N(2))-methyltransferase RsmD [Ornithinibacillus caprae]MUK89550.1 16S rRNA (guanine(966)-N(2))-methyltransferase RsmD [Ornithinibacillus caprae]